MRLKFIIVVFLFAMGSVPSVVWSADSVDIRFVRAHHGSSVSPALRDVEGLLRANLPYQGFELLTRTRMPLPNRGQSVSLARGYRLRCRGDARRLSVRVIRDDESVLNVAVALRPRNPVILGGFPDGSDRLLLVFVAP